MKQILARWFGIYDSVTPQLVPQVRVSMVLSSPIIIDIMNPTASQIISTIERLDNGKWDDAFLILDDKKINDAFMQAAKSKKNSYIVEYRDGTTGRQYQYPQLSKEIVKSLFLAYLGKYEPSAINRASSYAVSWKDITDEL